MEQKETLRDIWESQGMSLAETARKAGISDTTLANLNKGIQVSAATKGKVCKALGISLDYFSSCIIAESRDK